MARMISPVIALLFLFNAPASPSMSIEQYIVLISDVYNYYGTSCIMFVHSGEYPDLNTITLIKGLSQGFSRKNILSVPITFSELPVETKNFQGHIVRPLFVVILTADETMFEFANATKYLKISFPVWFVMFMKHPGSPLKTFCEYPTGNIFNLIFSTEMLVLCYDQPILKEWYALRDNRTRLFTLATWKPAQGLMLKTQKSLYGRRTNMYGEILRVASVDSPFVAVSNGELKKFFGGVVLELSKTMNFNIEILDSVESYGSWNDEEQAWTGVIGQLTTNVADFGVAEFTMTTNRLEVVDFTLPLMLSRNRLYFKKPEESSVQWSGYFKAFDAGIWSVIILIILTAPILLTVLKTKGDVTMKVMTDNYVHVWGIYCQQGLSELPSDSSLRLAFLSIFVSALIVSSAYSASLISFLTVNTASLPFSTIEEFAADGSYKMITFGNSADYDMFMSSNDSVLQKLKSLMKAKDELPIAVADGFQQVCSEKVGFYTTEAIKDAINIYLPCEVVSIEAGRIDSLALTLVKGSPYTGLINYHIQRFKDNGVLNKLKAMYLLTANPPETTYAPVGLWGIVPILAVLAGGTIFGCFILMFEKIYYNAFEPKCKRDDQSVKQFYETFTIRSPGDGTKKGKARFFKSCRKNNNGRPIAGYCP